MLQTSARILRLLSLLQARRDWTGPELADRLGVTTRTVRRDVDRLRELGYPVDGTSGVAGGYRLGVGAALPPLLLDDDEAVAVAIGLRTAAASGVTGLDETSVRALTKLEHLLPSRLRHRVNALYSVMEQVPGQGPTVDPALLTAVATACRDPQRLRFDYRAHDGTPTTRDVEPHRLVSLGRRWYLAAWDTDRAGWRSFRLDRIASAPRPGQRFTPRPAPGGDFAAFVQHGVSNSAYALAARVLLHVPVEVAADRVTPGAGMLEAVDERTCVLRAGADSPRALVLFLALLEFDFEILDPPELAGYARELAGRLGRAADASHAE